MMHLSTLFKFMFLQVLVVNGLSELSNTRNCSNAKSMCYNGPHISAEGQIMSCSVPGTFALIFGDGPSQYTSQLLDVLDQYGWKVTFFVIGKKVQSKNGKAVLTRAFKSGHQLAGHTNTHPVISTLSMEQLQREMTLNELAVMSVTGNLKPRYMMYPYGDATLEANNLVASMGYVKPIGWTFSTRDTFEDASQDAVGEYKKYLGGDNNVGVDFNKLSVISLQHDTVKQTVDSFGDLARYLQNNFASKGVRFVTLAECMNDTRPYTVVDKKNSDIITSPTRQLMVVMLTIVMFVSMLTM